MVVVEVPLWVLHSNIVKSTWDVESTEIGNTNEETNEENRIFLKSLFHSNSNKNLGRNAIYSVDATCSYNSASTITTASKRQPLRFATGGGDGKVRIWSCSSLVTTSSSHQEEEGYVGNKSKVMTRFTEKGGYESSSSSSSSTGDGATKFNNSNPTTNPATTTNNIHHLNNQQQQQQQGRSSRLLATLATHEGASVLCVRWSHSGHYLASAGDDGHVVLYCQKKQQQQQPKLMETSTSANGGIATTTTTEHWARVRTCRGHHLDVVGLAWASPDDRYLASCSLDVETPIIIWKLYDTLVGIPGYDIAKARSSTTTSTILTPFKVLGQSVHTSAVKGIVWDPIGKYLISSGDDPAICVWRTTADWGLEARIDSTSGIFATTSSTAPPPPPATATSSTLPLLNPAETAITANGTASRTTTTAEETIEQLANVSLFRRISFSYDGSHVCATNATVKGKNIAAMIAREGWAVSTGKACTTAAANLIGHKQPIVASRHLPILISHSSTTKRNTCNKRKLSIISNEDVSNPEEKEEVAHNDDNNDEEELDIEPSYASVIALGDKRGFVTVWSTKSSRPIFKIQVSSEKSKCTITDLSWTTTATNNSNSNGAILLVSMLDGYIASLQFTWEELGGTPLTFKQRCRLFRLRYGIELVDDNNNINSAIRMKYTDETKLLENAFQLNLEEDYNLAQVATNQSASVAPKQLLLSSTKSTNDTLDTKSKQIESRTTRGKKRIQPVLVSVEDDLMMDTNDTVAVSSAAGPTDATTASSTAANGPVETPPLDNPISTALQDAKKAASAAQELTNKYATKEEQQHKRVTSSSTTPYASGPHTVSSSSYEFHNTPTLIPPCTNQTFSVTLSSERKTQNQHQKLMDTWSPAVGCLTDIPSSSLVADCSNTTVSSPTTGTITKATLTVSSQGTVIWKDTVIGAKCTALAASSQRLAMGTYDGTIYLYGTTVGFPSGFIVRSLPPLILGSSIALLQLVDNHKLLVICSNGDFRVYDLTRKKLNQKGSVAPVFSHVRLTQATSSHLQKQPQGLLPKLVRAQLTAAGIVILLSTQNRAAIAASGSSLQAFFYDAQLEEWVRVADGRFYLSDFYVGRASNSVNRQATTLSELDSLVSWTSSSSGGGGGGGSSSSAADSTNIASVLLDSIYRNAGEKSDASRVHCEDRMACSLALGSPSEFQHWLRLYSRLLTSEGDVTYLRCLCDVLMGNKPQPADYVPAGPLRGINADIGTSSAIQSAPDNYTLWWVDANADRKLLGLDRADLLRLVVAEMGRNRELQRLTNEILIELSTL